MARIVLGASGRRALILPSIQASAIQRGQLLSVAEAFFTAMNSHLAPPEKSIKPLNVEFLRACSSSLWLSLNKTNASKKEARQQFFAALAWLARQNGWKYCENVQQTYFQDGVRIAGRVHAAIFDEKTYICVEFAYEIQPPQLLKLLAAYHAGRRVLFLWAGPATSDPTLSQRIASALNDRPTTWLRFCQLGATRPAKRSA